MSKTAFGSIAGVVCGLIALVASPANASFHFWGINEVYSDATGTVQFVEMYTDSSGETFMSGQSFKSNANTLVLNHDLAFPTNGKSFLMASPGYAALASVPAPDYVFPTNNFFSLAGDTLTLQFATGNIVGAGQPASLNFTGAQLPTNGVQSLRYDLTVNTINSPTNFAGATGAVPEPASFGAIVISMGLLTRRFRV